MTRKGRRWRLILTVLGLESRRALESLLSWRETVCEDTGKGAIGEARCSVIIKATRLLERRLSTAFQTRPPSSRLSITDREAFLAL